jgi:hypothetical protein
MTDPLVEFHSLAGRVASALNAAEVGPVPEGMIGALMVIVGDDDQKNPPIGGTINFDRKSGKWEIAIELSISERVDEHPEN